MVGVLKRHDIGAQLQRRKTIPSRLHGAHCFVYFTVTQMCEVCSSELPVYDGDYMSIYRALIFTGAVHFLEVKNTSLSSAASEPLFIPVVACP